MKLRPRLQWFAYCMELRLHRYDEERGREGWRNKATDPLVTRHHREQLLDKLNTARKDLERALHEVRPGSVIVASAADVANYAMMVADVSRYD